MGEPARPFGFAGGVPGQPPADPYGTQTSHAERVEAALNRTADTLQEVVKKLDELNEHAMNGVEEARKLTKALRDQEARENSAAERARRNAARRDSAGGKKPTEKR